MVDGFRFLVDRFGCNRLLTLLFHFLLSFLNLNFSLILSRFSCMGRSKVYSKLQGSNPFSISYSHHLYKVYSLFHHLLSFLLSSSRFSSFSFFIKMSANMSVKHIEKNILEFHDQGREVILLETYLVLTLSIIITNGTTLPRNGSARRFLNLNLLLPQTDWVVLMLQN